MSGKWVKLCLVCVLVSQIRFGLYLSNGLGCLWAAFEEYIRLGLDCIAVVWMMFGLDENWFKLCLRVG